MISARPGERRLRVGVAGAGQIARVHAPLIEATPGAELVGIADPDTERAASLARGLGQVAVHASLDVLLAEHDLDVVHVLTPPHLHGEVGLRAIEAGCHVLVEKPLALTEEEARRMLEAADRCGVGLRVNHNLLHDGLIRRALRAVEEGKVGDVVSVHVDYPYDPRRSREILEPGAEHHHWVYSLPGGPLQDLFPHPASLLTRLLDEMDEVQVLRGVRGVLPGGHEDELRVAVRSGDRFGSIHLSLSERPDAVTLAVRGTGGSLRADLYAHTLVLRRRSGLPRAVSRGLAGFSASRQHLTGGVRNVVDVVARRIDKSGGIGPLIEEFYGELLEGRVAPGAPGAMATVRLMNRVWPPRAASTGGRRREATVPPGKESDLPAAAPRPAGRGRCVLITGATGFIGTHLVRRLSGDGWGVRALVRPDSSRAGRVMSPEIDVRWADLADEEGVRDAVAGADLVLHAGSAVSGDWDDHRRSTVEGTRHIMRAALEHGVRRMVFLSSLAVYDLEGAREGDVIREDHPHHPEPGTMGPYARAKIEAERALLDAHHRDGLPVTVLRPGMVVGPHGSVFFPHLGYRIAGSLYMITAPRDLVLPLTYVENTVEAVLAASEREEAVGEAFNVVDEGEVTAEEYLRRLEAAGGAPPMVRLPRAVPYAATVAYELAASLGLVKKGVTSRAQLRWKRAPVRFSAEKARRLLDWRERVPLDAGVARTFRWHRQAG